MQDMRNDGFALKQNALGRVLNKDDPNQVEFILVTFVAANINRQTFYGEIQGWIYWGGGGAGGLRTPPSPGQRGRRRGGGCYFS
jgi:hypothetical protein